MDWAFSIREMSNSDISDLFPASIIPNLPLTMHSALPKVKTQAWHTTHVFAFKRTPSHASLPSLWYRIIFHFFTTNHFMLVFLAQHAEYTSMIKRRIQQDIETNLQHFPAIGLVVPRQSGNTTLAKVIHMMIY
jgi:hypothetical protein